MPPGGKKTEKTKRKSEGRRGEVGATSRKKAPLPGERTLFPSPSGKGEKRTRLLLSFLGNFGTHVPKRKKKTGLFQKKKKRGMREARGEKRSSA